MVYMCSYFLFVNVISSIGLFSNSIVLCVQSNVMHVRISRQQKSTISLPFLSVRWILTLQTLTRMRKVQCSKISVTFTKEPLFLNDHELRAYIYISIEMLDQKALESFNIKYVPITENTKSPKMQEYKNYFFHGIYTCSSYVLRIE